MKRLVLSVTKVTALVLSIAAPAAWAAEITYDLHPIFQQEYIASGSPTSGGATSVKLYWGSQGETRGVYEYLLPQLPTGAVIADAFLDFNMTQYSGGGSSLAEATFHAYQGDGVYASADGNVPTNYIARTGPVTSFDIGPLDFDHTYLTNLYNANATHLGLMAWQENYGHTINLSRGQYFANDHAPMVQFTVNTPDPITGFFNGDFETGNLFNWESYVTANGSVSTGLPTVEPFDVTGTGLSNAAKFKVGLETFESGAYGGGGIRQTFNLDTSGDYVFDLDFASFNNDLGGNTAPGFFELILDDQVIASQNLTGTLISPGQTIRDSLNALVPNLAAGEHTLAVQVTRPATNSREIFQYIDNIMMTLVDAPVSKTLLPTFDARATWNGAAFDVADGDTSIRTQDIDYADIDRRGIMEFSLDQIPDNAYITSATLTLSLSSFTYTTLNGETFYPILSLLGYSGNGLLDVTDATAATLADLIGTSDPVTELEPITINLDVNFIQSLLGTGNYLGLLAIGDPEGDQINWHALETLWGDEYWPELEITYTFSAPIAGDLNGDGFVGQDDLNIILTYWGQNVDSGDSLQGDPTGDGFVGQDDLSKVLTDWGQGTPPSLTLIPEPATGAVALLLCAGCIARTRRPRLA